MLITSLIVAAAVAQAYGAQPAAPTERSAPPVPAASAPPVAVPVGRALKDLPNTTTTYYDIPGKTGPQIEKSLGKIYADPASKEMVRLVIWNVGTQITKRTQGPKCTIQSATSTLTGKVQLPRLAEEAKISKQILDPWRIYVAKIEAEAAATLWFVSDRLRGAEQSLVGMNCDQATPAWNAKLDDLTAQVKARSAAPAPTGIKPGQVN